MSDDNLSIASDDATLGDNSSTTGGFSSIMDDNSSVASGDETAREVEEEEEVAVNPDEQPREAEEVVATMDDNSLIGDETPREVEEEEQEVVVPPREVEDEEVVAAVDDNSSIGEETPREVEEEEDVVVKPDEQSKQEKGAKQSIERWKRETVGEIEWNVDTIFKGKGDDRRDVTASVMAVISSHNINVPAAIRRYKAALNHCINAKPTKGEGKRYSGIPRSKRTLEALCAWMPTTEYDYKILQASSFFFIDVLTLNQMLIELEQKLQQKDMPDPDEAKGNESDVTDEGRVSWPKDVYDTTKPKEVRLKAFVDHLFRHVTSQRERLCLDWMAKCMADPKQFGSEELSYTQRAKILDYFKVALPSIHASPFKLKQVKFDHYVPTKVIKFNRSIAYEGDLYEEPHELLDKYPEMLERRAAKAREEAQKKIEAAEKKKEEEKAEEERKEKEKEEKREAKRMEREMREKEKERKKKERWDAEMKKGVVRWEDEEGSSMAMQDQSSDARDAHGQDEGRSLFPSNLDTINNEMPIERERDVESGEESEDIGEEEDWEDAREEIEGYMREVKLEEPDEEEEEEVPVRNEEELPVGNEEEVEAGTDGEEEEEEYEEEQANGAVPPQVDIQETAVELIARLLGNNGRNAGQEEDELEDSLEDVEEESVVERMMRVGADTNADEEDRRLSDSPLGELYQDCKKEVKEELIDNAGDDNESGGFRFKTEEDEMEAMTPQRSERLSPTPEPSTSYSQMRMKKEDDPMKTEQRGTSTVRVKQSTPKGKKKGEPKAGDKRRRSKLAGEGPSNK